MTLLSTVLRGLRSRALLSAGSALLVAMAVGSAVLGPQFALAVTNSFLITRLDEAPAQLTALSWVYTADADADVDATAATQAAVRAADGAMAARVDGLFEPAQRGILISGYVTYQTVDWRVLAVDEACDHLELTGRCPSAPGEVLMLAGDAERTLTPVGGVLALPGVGDVTVVGTYLAPPASQEDFWVAPIRFVSQPPNPRVSPPVNYRPAPLVTPAETFAALGPDEFSVTVDRLIELGPRLTDDDLPALASVTAIQQGDPVVVPGGVLTPSPVNDLAGLAAEVRNQQRAARSSISPAVISVVLVALALLLRLLTAAADLRLPELALAGLRGVPRRRMWRLGLSEPLVVLAVAVPCGAVLGLASARLLARAWLVPGLPVPLPLLAVAAGVGVALAAVAVAVVAVGLVLRLPLTEQLTGVRRPRPTGRAALVVQLVLVAAAVAILASKLSAGGPGDPDVTDLALPVLLAVVAGLAATRLSVLLARLRTRRRTRSLSTYVASRAISRRQEGSLVILPVTAAIAICVFGAGVYSSAATWRASVAATAAPAPVLWTSGQSLAGTVELTHRIDPDGQWLMAASTLSSQGPTYSILDTDRLARVGDWQDQWTPGIGPEEINRLLAPRAVQPVLQGSSVSLTVDRESDAGDDLYVRLRLAGAAADGEGDAGAVFLGPYPPGTSTASTEIAACSAGCAVEEITLGRRAALPLAITGEVTLSDLAVDGVRLAGAFTDGGWNAVDAVTDSPTITGVDIDAGALVIGLDAPTPAIAQLSAGDVPDRLPVVRGVDARIVADSGAASVTSEIEADLDPVLTARSVPLLGPVGVLIDYRTFSTGRTLYEQGTPVYVLARADTPTSVTDQLSAQGITVATTEAAQRRVLDNSAYALALRLYAVVAGLVLLMALAGLFVSSAVQLPARRRDAAALRVIGIPRRTVVSSVIRELGFVLGATAVAGLAAGSLAQYVVLRTVTLGFAENITIPTLVASLDPVRLVVLAFAAAVLFGGVAVVSALLVVRGARGSTLRESAR